MPSPEPTPGRCNARCRGGGYCTGKIVPGTSRCGYQPHQGVTKEETQAKRALALELEKWLLTQQPTDGVDPADLVLKALAQSAARADWYALKLAQAVAHGDRLQELARRTAAGLELSDDETVELREHANRLDQIFAVGGLSALVGHTWAMTQKGQKYATGEEIRALAKLEADERKFLVQTAKIAAAMGIAERDIRIREQLGAAVFAAVIGSLRALGVETDTVDVLTIVQGQLALAAADPAPEPG